MPLLALPDDVRGDEPFLVAFRDGDEVAGGVRGYGRKPLVTRRVRVDLELRAEGIPLRRPNAWNEHEHDAGKPDRPQRVAPSWMERTGTWLIVPASQGLLTAQEAAHAGWRLGHAGAPVAELGLGAPIERWFVVR